jgi:hypothetical protein
MVFGADSSQLAYIGGEHGSQVELERIMSAKILESTRQVVVLDANPPHLRLFDWNGSHLRSFANRGSGPGEVETPVAFGTIGDSLILVGELSGRYTLFSTSGAFLRTVRYPLLLPMGIGEACGNWIIYTPRAIRELAPGDSRSPWDGNMYWLHTLTPELAEISKGVYLTDSRDRRATMRWGGLSGLSANSSGGLIHHTHGSIPRLFQWRCNGHPFALEEIARLPNPHSHNEEVDEHDLNMMRVTPGEKHFFGASRLLEGHLFAEGVVQSGGRVLTSLHRGLPAGTSGLQLARSWVLHDGIPGVGVLFQDTEGAPRLILIAENEITSRLR